MKNEKYICRCSAYNFPHTFGEGACDGRAIAQDYFEDYAGLGTCYKCDCLGKYNGRLHCSIADGVEKPQYGKCIQIFIEKKGIKLK